MAKLTKTNSGLIFKDDFSERTLMWTLSPSDADNLSFGENGLQMKHNKRYTSYTIVEPVIEEYSCIVELDHIPVNYDDIAGVLVMSSTKDYAECQTYLATGPSELGNAELVNTDIKNMINEILADNVVTYTVDVDNDTDNPITPSVQTQSVSIMSDEPFVDTFYRYIKFTKNKYKYIFWASEDCVTWIEIGNVKFDNAGVIGFFIYGTEDEEILNNSHCFFKSFEIYNSKYITIDGIDRKHEVEIFDGDGNIILRTDDIRYIYSINRSNKRILFNSTTSPMPIRNGKLRIFPKDKYEQTIAMYDMGEETFGGDGFSLERDISVFIDNKEVKTDKLYDLGIFYRGSYFIKADVHNNEEYAISDVKITVIKYSEYYSGEEQVEVALFEDGISETKLDYHKEVIIPEIRPSEGRSVYIKLKDKPNQGVYDTGNDFRFKILVE